MEAFGLCFGEIEVASCFLVIALSFLADGLVINHEKIPSADDRRRLNSGASNAWSACGVAGFHLSEESRFER